MAAYEKVVQRDSLEYPHGVALQEPQGLDSFTDSPYSQHFYEPTVGNDHDAYVNGTPVGDQDQKFGLKRKRSDLGQFELAPPEKKHIATQLQVSGPPALTYHDNSGQTSPYSPFVSTPTSTASFHPGQSLGPNFRPQGHHYSTSNASQISLAAPSPHTPAWSPAFSAVKTEPSPPAPMTPLARPASSSPLKSSIPKLVRTSTIHQASPIVNPSYHVPQSFNPYAYAPLKASLKLKGDLDSMTRNWSADEIDARRRLVEFKRSQDSNIITAEFNPVAPQDRAPSSITISCILWKEKMEYYVTSVDTIYLLEALVGVRFTVEEKNRIRRNLEGFRPATVSKSKQDSEEFFKVIMGFPHPKPRNIEKDVKVFPWKILAHALKKIISKYSASYSSTAASLATPVPSNFSGSNDGSVDFGYASPHPEYSQMSHYPFTAQAASYAQVQMSGRMSAPVTTAPFPELQLQVPVTAGPVMNGQDYDFNMMPGMPQAGMLMTAEATSAPPRHASWDFGPYVNDTPMIPTPNSAPPAMFNRGPIETAEFVTQPAYTQYCR